MTGSSRGRAPAWRSAVTVLFTLLFVAAGVVAAAGPSRAQVPAGSGLPQPRTEIPSLRNPYANVYREVDGTRTAVIHSKPVNYKRADGSWAAVNPSLRATSADGYAWANVGGPLDLRFSRTAASEQIASVESNGRSIAFGLESLTSASLGEVEGDRITYANALPNVDLVYESKQDALKELIVLRQAPKKAVSFRFSVNLDGLTPRVERDGAISLLRTDGAVELFIPAASMTDAKVDLQSNEPAFSDAVTMELVAKDGEYELTLTPDLAWLQDPKRAYPVEIDPTVTTPIVGDTFVQTGITSGQSGSDELKAGTFNGGTTKARSLLRFNIASVRDKEIISATFSLYEFHSWSCSASEVKARRIDGDWSGATVNWANQPPDAASAFDILNVAKGFSGSCPDGRINFDATTLVRQWANDTHPNHGIMVRAGDESSNNGWKKFRSEDYGGASTDPKLEVTYNSYPTAVSARSPGAGTVSSDTTPTLSAKYNDPDAGDVGHVDYQICGNASCSSVILNGSGTAGVQPGHASPWTVPAGSALTMGQTYWWRARSDDGRVQSAWSAAATYTANASPPSTPTELIPNTGVVTTLSPTLSALYSDPDEVDTGYVRFEVYDAATTSLVAAGNGTTVEPGARSSWTVPSGLVDGRDYYWRAWSNDGTVASGLTENQDVVVALGGDIFHATLYTDDPASGGQLIAKEWARLNTFTARYEDPGMVATRGPAPCPSRLTGSPACEEVRNTSVGGGRDLEGFSTYVGRELDPLLQQVVSILDPVTQDLGEPAETGPIASALESWQTPPPVHSDTYTLYVATDSETGDQLRTWIDDRTMLPLKAVDVMEGITQEIYWSYETTRQVVGELPPNFFRVAQPWNTGVEKRVELLGPQPIAEVVDTDTGQTYEPYSLGTIASLVKPTGEEVDLCLNDSYVVDLTVAPSELETLNEPDPDPEIAPDPASPTETYVRANYVELDAGEQCRPGRMDAETPALTVTSMPDGSARATAARSAIQDSALEIESNPLDLEFNHAGTTFSQVGGAPTLSYVTPADDVSYSAFLEPANSSTAIVLLGEFDKGTLNVVATNLEP